MKGKKGGGRIILVRIILFLRILFSEPFFILTLEIHNRYVNFSIPIYHTHKDETERME
jgi:hypothetical protein